MSAIELTAVADLDGVFILRSGALRCVAVHLSNGEICLYSPVPGLNETMYASLERLGAVSVLLAPNHYHHKALRDHALRFPKASLICASAARARLQKQTGLVFESLGLLDTRLLSTMRLLQPEGLKTGEVWLQIACRNELAWVVCDGFSAFDSSVESRSVSPTMLGTFPKFGVLDRAVYSAWVKSEIFRRPPNVLIPCHGPMVRALDLGARLDELLDNSL